MIIRRRVVSSGAQENSDPVRIGGMGFSVQTVGPAALIGIEVSHDGQNWAAARRKTAVDDNALTTIQSVFEEVRERPEWARFIVAIDGGAPQTYEVLFHIRKDLQLT